jgi:methylmalonyl-CoA mutase cobalamin-binding subunit
MNFSKFHKTVQQILKTDLPSSQAIVKAGHAMARDIRIGRTAFMDKMGVESELAYKKKCMRENTIMFHAHIGMNSWNSTKAALVLLDNTAAENGFMVDRAGICLDRRMGLPKAHRKNIPAETGPMLESKKDWKQVGQTVPIQPHMGDFMIGFPASTDNTIQALKAGVTTIGNLSQFFAHEVPQWKDRALTAAETAKAIAIMGALRNKGTMVHSYLEDGFGALFYDCATVAGWAYLENYIVETLLGAKLAHCIGGLTTDPIKRAGWAFALHKIHAPEGVGSMFYGDTLSFTPDFTLNQGIVAEYLLWDIMAQLECPTGHAVLPLPVTEALRVPSAEEIAEAQKFGRQIEKAARRIFYHFDFGESYQFCDTILAAGRSVFDNALDGLKASGVDISDPVQMLFVLKNLGPAVFEEMFGAGRVQEDFIRGRMPIKPTDVFEMSNKYFNEYRQMFVTSKMRTLLGGRRLLIASTDVHEHAVTVISQLLSEAGAEMIYMGAEVNPDEIASEANTQNAEAILVSTHNGMALEYAKQLREAMEKQKIRLPVLIGGILNQKVESQSLPVDVTGNLKELGFYPCARLEGRFKKMLESNIRTNEQKEKNK